MNDYFIQNVDGYRVLELPQYAKEVNKLESLKNFAGHKFVEIAIKRARQIITSPSRR